MNFILLFLLLFNSGIHAIHDGDMNSPSRHIKKGKSSKSSSFTTSSTKTQSVNTETPNILNFFSFLTPVIPTLPTLPSLVTTTIMSDIPQIDRYCGIWVQHCVSAESLGLGNMIDIQQEFNISHHYPNYYLSKTNLFNTGNHCQREKQLTIEQIGRYHVGAHTELPLMPYGNNLKIIPRSFIVTPYSDTFVITLNMFCPCGGSWVLKQSRELPINGCSNSVCSLNTDFIQPFGGEAYGNIWELRDRIWLSKLSKTKSGY